MKKIKQNIFKKVIPIFLVFIAIFTFILPNYVHAENGWEKLGGVLLQPIKMLLCGIGDSVMQKLQNIFVTYETEIEQRGDYVFKYTPAVIFSGKVPGFSINFISPPPDGIKTRYWVDNGEFFWHDGGMGSGDPGTGELYDNLKTNYDLDLGPHCTFFGCGDINGAFKINWRTDYGDEYILDTYPWGSAITSLFWMFDDKDWLSDDSFYIELFKNGVEQDTDFSNINQLKGYLVESCYFPDNAIINKRDEVIITWKSNDDIKYTWYLFDDYNQGIDSGYECVTRFSDAGACFALARGGGVFNFTPTEETATEEWKNKSTALALQPTISKMYKAMRIIALVSLLSTLVYIAIRIIISSTSKDSAKYKKMLVDWLVAICLLFILHYVMVFILDMVELITNFLSGNILTEDGTDVFFAQIRWSVEYSASFIDQFATTLMYVALVILTITFTFQYLKRVIYMTFLTMIAPLICLTYPLDKIKDGQAQALSMWLREYIFNALLQPLHLVIYFLLIGTANDLISINAIYAIVAIGFMVPAEKFMRKMFGFEKAGTVSQLGAAAGGAMIMNGMNKLKGMGHKGGAKGGNGGSGEANKPIRTATNPASLAPLQNGSSSSVTSPNSSVANHEGTDAGNENSNVQVANDAQANSQNGRERIHSLDTSTTRVQQVGLEGTASTSSDNASGVHGISAPQQKKRKKIGGFINGVGTRYKLWGKGSLKQWGKRGAKLLGVAGGLTAGMIGMGAGVASGDASKAFQYGAAGVAAGYAVGNAVGNIPGNIIEGTANGINAGLEGADPEAYQNKQADKKFRQSKEYAALERKYGSKEMREYSQEFLNAGITDISKMKKAIDSGMSSADALAYIKMAKDCPASILHDRTKLEAFLSNNGIPTDNVDELYKNIKKFS